MAVFEDVFKTENSASLLFISYCPIHVLFGHSNPSPYQPCNKRESILKLIRCVKVCDKMANSVNPDQTDCSKGAV